MFDRWYASRNTLSRRRNKNETVNLYKIKSNVANCRQTYIGNLIVELKKAKIKDIILVIGYRDDVVKYYFNG